MVMVIIAIATIGNNPKSLKIGNKYIIYLKAVTSVTFGQVAKVYGAVFAISKSKDIQTKTA